MKKSTIVLGITVAALMSGCASINRTKVGNKEVITASRATPVFFTLWGSPVSSCIEDLNAEGVKEVSNANGSPTEGLFILARLFSVDTCQATGVK